MKPIYALFTLLALVMLWLMFRNSTQDAPMPDSFPEPPKSQDPQDGPQLATFGGGCFWCTEAYFLQISGVKQVVSGYAGGHVVNPTYEQVCSGTTGHAECIQITYDPSLVRYSELLEVFWRTHDPTTKNRQGNDEGPQYRSVVFTHTPAQKAVAEDYLRKIEEAKVYPAPVVTEIVPLTVFYPAEKYHQNYYAQNPRQPYCYSMIRPKLEKLKKVFANKIKE
jgi:peptide-methionine (S)-S-oxide reductase